MSSQFQVLGPCTAKLRWSVDVRVQSTCMRAAETADDDHFQTQPVHTAEVGQLTRRYVPADTQLDFNEIFGIARLWRPQKS